MIIVIVAICLLLASGLGILVVRGVLALAPSPHRAQAAALLRGGRIIGVLERLAVAGTILLGFPEGIAIIVAIKGLGRYPELRSAAQRSEAASTVDSGAVGAAVSERFIIGTLASLVWSVGCAAAASRLLAVV